MFSYGKNIKFFATEESWGVRFVIENFPKGVTISPADLGKQLEKRKCDWVELDPNEEIEFLSGIGDEATNGEKIEFTYQNGDLYSALIVAGALCKKALKGEVTAYTWEVGGINTNEKNKEYIKTALQKMLLENGSLGGTVECQLNNIDVDNIKSAFTQLVFIIPGVEAVQFSKGVMASKLTAENYNKEGRILITLRPDLSRKSPCTAVDKAVVIESLLAIAAADIKL